VRGFHNYESEGRTFESFRAPSKSMAYPPTTAAGTSFGNRAFPGRLAWENGHWRHEMHDGRYGWWWDVDGAWYFYEEPIYPYPG
jgi:hypothetical protein